MSVFGTTDLGLFILAGLLLNITLGVDLLYITNRSAIQGRQAGVVAALGIGSGCLVHVLAASLGLSVILVSSSFIFSCVKYLGAGYLLYLGIHTLLSLRKKSVSQEGVIKALPLSRIFRQAVMINVLNPKVALFFMALLPQFVSPSAPYPALSFCFLGLLFTLNGTIVNSVFALLTSTLAGKLRSVSVLSTILKSLVGALFVSLGVRLALFS